MLDEDATSDALTASSDASRRRLGLAVLLFSAVFFGLNNNLARLSYDHGTNVLTLLTIRTIVAILAIGLYVTWFRLWRRFGRVDMPAFAAASLTFAVGSLLLLESFRLMPVSLAVLFFYLFPIMVALIYLALGEERLTLVGWVGVFAAFCGLALALDVFEGFDLSLLGILLALGAAGCIALNIVSSHRLMQRYPGILVTFWLMVVSQIIFAIGMVAVTGIALPTAGTGVLVFGGAVIAGPIALISFFVGLSMAGGTRTALVMNSEPVTTMLFAVAILGETLGWLQYTGAAIVIASIVLVNLAERRRAGTAAEPT
ncbi:MAG: DMT family transporter [Alphaproteobacteria bacterium]